MLKLLKNRARVIKTLAWRELKSTLYGIGLYIELFFIFLLSSLVLRNYVQSIQDEGVLVFATPLYYPLYISVLIGSIYLALTSTVTISREREEKTLKTLFFAPVDNLSYLLGKYIHQIMVFIFILGFILVYLILASLIINFKFSFTLLKMLFQSVFIGSAVLSFGIFISTISGKTKTSIVLLISVILFFLGFQGASIFLGAINLEEVSGLIIFSSRVINTLNSGIRWISPFSYLTRAVRIAQLNNLSEYFKNIITIIIYNIVFLSLAIFVFNRKGVS